MKRGRKPKAKSPKTKAQRAKESKARAARRENQRMRERGVTFVTDPAPQPAAPIDNRFPINDPDRYARLTGQAPLMWRDFDDVYRWAKSLFGARADNEKLGLVSHATACRLCGTGAVLPPNVAARIAKKIRQATPEEVAEEAARRAEARARLAAMTEEEMGEEMAWHEQEHQEALEHWNKVKRFRQFGY